MKKKIVMINTGPFPEGDAGAVRLRMMGRALVEAGYDVEVLCRGNVKEVGWVDGIHYTSLKNTNGHAFFRGIDLYLGFPYMVKRYLRRNKDIFCVYLYFAHNSVFEYCKRFCRENNIRLIYDCVEWYSADEFKDGEKNRAYIALNRRNSQIVDQSFSVIAISRYLENYYSGKGIPTLRVPILCDGQQCAPQKNNAELLTLFYAGLPFRKDYIGNLLQAALLLSEEEQKKIRIVLVGATEDYLIHSSDVPKQVLDSCASFLQLKGRVPRADVLKLMEDADFTILPRDASRRYAQAGFPSKVVESLANATPILCNYSSDLELYLHDGDNALIADDHTPEALVKTIRRALALSPEEKSRMSRNAIKSAEKYFDYRKYSATLGAFLENE